MNSLVLKRGIAALGLSLAIAASAAVPASFAQPAPSYPQAQGQQYGPPPAPQGQYGAPQGQYGQRFGRDHRGDRGQNRIDRRIAFLHQRLAITPAQEAAWTDFATELRNSDMAAQRDRAMHERDHDHASTNIVQRLELRERMMERRSADLDRVVRALRPLYASFSDEQKRTADQLLFHPGEQGRNGGPEFHGGPRGGERAPG